MTFKGKTGSLVLCLLANLCLSSAAWAGPPSAYREISTVDISTQAKSSAATDPQMCAAFKLSVQRVKRLLQTAREIDVRTYAHDLDTSACTVEGRLTLRNGLTGHWQVQMGGGMRVEFEDQHVMLMQCKRCGKPFAN